MSGETANPNETADHYLQVRRVLLQVLIANLVITFVKIGLGLATGALAVVADGFHSLVDSSSNLIGLAAVRLAARPADRRYPYGYRRYETVGALAIGGMMLAAAWEIGGAILNRFFSGGTPEITPLAVVLFAFTFPVNLVLVYLETRAGRQLNSEILLADAAHTRTDLYVSISVIVSLVGTWLGLSWLDLVIAALVVLLILRAAVQILREAAGWLTDTKIADPEAVEAIAQSVPGVLYAHRIRSRGAPDAGFVDLHVKVHPGMSTSQAHAIASEVENRLKAELPQIIDALVHIEPGPQQALSDWDKISYDLRQVADGMGLGLHDLHVHADREGNYVIELHLEMPGELSLGEAHAKAEEFEGRAQAMWPRASSVITHMEPITPAVLPVVTGPIGPLKVDLGEAVRAQVGEGNLLELKLRTVGGHYSAAIRIRLPAEATLAEAHAKAETLERELLTRFPELYRVTVHVEPPS
jgi:cation diffusion facilitator family transporter